MRSPCAALLILLLLSASPALQAQIVTGRLTEDGTGAPVAGAFVQLLGVDGARHAGVLTDAEGRFRLRARAPGEYRLHAEQLGFRSSTSQVLDVGSGGLNLDITLHAQALVLPEVRAHAEERRCRRRPDGAAVHDLWTAIRGALMVTAWASEARALHYSTVNYVRELDASGRRIRREDVTPMEGHAAHPYRAVSATFLARQGYLVEDGSQLMLLGLDAEVLLSDEFLDTHCFRLVTGRDPSMIGLGFEPLRRDGRTDVKGVLWVARDSARLSHVEYEFENLPAHIRRFGARGEVRFQRLETGMWIVERWSIRTPVVTRRIRALELTGYREDGGIVTTVRRADENLPARATGSIEGVVTDSIRGGVLRGARVFLSGTGFMTETDEHGRFRIDGVPAGRYALSFMHPELIPLRVPMPLDSVVVVENEPAHHSLTTASLRTILRTVCPEEEEDRPEGLIYGTVGGGAPVAGLQVTASWRGPAPTGGGALVERRRTAYTRTDGLYVLCWVPTDREVMLRVDRSTARLLPDGRPIVRRDFD